VERRTLVTIRPSVAFSLPGWHYLLLPSPGAGQTQGHAQINFTAPDSRILLNSDKAFIQGYYAQAAVDAETHIIAAADLTGQAADSPDLKEMVQQVEKNTGRLPEELSALPPKGLSWSKSRPDY